MPLRLRLRLAALCETVLLALVRLLLPAEGRHRAMAPPPTPAPPHSPPLAPEPVWLDTALVRPYLLTPQERRERRSGTGRRFPAVEVSA